MDDKEPTLADLQGLVGGYIEVVYLEGNKQLIVNEEGLLLGLEPNKPASMLAGTLIVGNAVMLEGTALLT
tara:strand:+ start:734 stop:943 length:210 start_codon:yes stop_codon:yes gene_type:complete